LRASFYGRAVRHGGVIERGAAGLVRCGDRAAKVELVECGSVFPAGACCVVRLKSGAALRVMELRRGMPQTEPVAPPRKPREEPEPQRKPAPVEPRRKPDPFNPDWPKTRPTPEPKA
jgi:hypothetical protein